MIGRFTTIVSLAGLLAFAASDALVAGADTGEGKMLLEQNCGRCHAIEATGTSPLAKAPPLREVYLKFPIDQWEAGLAEGMGSRHRDMPQIQFSSEQVAAILDYLGTISGVAPSQRPHFQLPGETPP